MIWRGKCREIDFSNMNSHREEKTVTQRKRERGRESSSVGRVEITTRVEISEAIYRAQESDIQ